MDQQRDTMNTPSSSHRATKQTGFGHGASPLPTLFELPDLSPAAIRAKQLPTGAVGEHAVHQPHIGPPAGHFDTRPGTGQAGGRRFPRTPVTEDGVTPSFTVESTDQHSHSEPQIEDSLADSEIDSPESDQINPQPIAASSNTGTAAALQATFGDTSTFVAESTEKKASWGGRAAMALLLMLLVSFAFLSGRGFHRSQSTPDADLIAAAKTGTQTDVHFDHREREVLVELERPSSEQLAPDEIMSDFPPLLSDDPNPENIAGTDHMSANRSTASDEKDRHDGSAVASITRPEAASGPMSNKAEKTTDDILAEIEAFASNGPANGPVENSAISSQRFASRDPRVNSFSGLPSSTASQQPQSPNFDGLADDFDGSLPGLGQPPDAVVAYRNDERPKLASDDLPSGMGDRLQLEQGIQYSQTPHAIGGFLEILKAWETEAAGR